MSEPTPPPGPVDPAPSWPRSARTLAWLALVPWGCVGATLVLRAFDAAWFVCAPVSTVLGWGLAGSGVLQLATGFIGGVALLRGARPRAPFAAPLLSVAGLVALLVVWPEVTVAYYPAWTHTYCEDTPQGRRMVSIGDGHEVLLRRVPPDAGAP